MVDVTSLCATWPWEQSQTAASDEPPGSPHGLAWLRTVAESYWFRWHEGNCESLHRSKLSPGWPAASAAASTRSVATYPSVQSAYQTKEPVEWNEPLGTKTRLHDVGGGGAPGVPQSPQTRAALSLISYGFASDVRVLAPERLSGPIAMNSRTQMPSLWTSAPVQFHEALAGLDGGAWPLVMGGQTLVSRRSSLRYSRSPWSPRPM